MLLPIYLAWLSKKPLSPQQISIRLECIRKFLHLESDQEYLLHTFSDGHSGLAYLELRQNPFAIPLCFSSESELAVSAYLPFGASEIVDRKSLTSGMWINDLLDILPMQPSTLRKLAPPQVICQLDKKRHLLSLINDWRGLGRLYEYNTSFGLVWSNKMAATLLFAGVSASLDKNALADMAAFGMFSGDATGYDNLRLCSAGTRILIDTASNTIKERYHDSAFYGVSRSRPSPHAVEEAHEAICSWIRDLECFRKSKINLYLSGGRDSRVVAAALINLGVDFDVTLCSPPLKDAELAKKLLHIANVTTNIEEQTRRNEILHWYKNHTDLLSIADNFLRRNNSDISVKLYLSWPNAVENSSNHSIKLCGDQGESTHNCLYTSKHFESEQILKNSTIKATSKRVNDFVDTITIKAFGIQEWCGLLAKNNIQHNTLRKADEANFSDLYVLDFLCFSLYLTRQWPCANGIFDRKSPLTVYPYAHNGINQEIQSKLHSNFVRDVISSFLPVWGDIPFFHELLQEDTEDFYEAYPTYWQMGRGEEILELCQYNDNTLSWEYFQKKQIIETFRNLLNTSIYNTTPPRKTSIFNTTSQKILWILTIENNLFEINKICTSSHFMYSDSPQFVSNRSHPYLFARSGSVKNENMGK